MLKKQKMHRFSNEQEIPKFRYRSGDIRYRFRDFRLLGKGLVRQAVFTQSLILRNERRMRILFFSGLYVTCF